MISQVRWREGVKEEIPNLLTYHAKAQLSELCVVKSHSFLFHQQLNVPSRCYNNHFKLWMLAFK